MDIAGAFARMRAADQAREHKLAGLSVDEKIRKLRQLEAEAMRAGDIPEALSCQDRRRALHSTAASIRARRHRREQRDEAILELHRRGLSCRQIARHDWMIPFASQRRRIAMDIDGVYEPFWVSPATVSLTLRRLATEGTE